MSEKLQVQFGSGGNQLAGFNNHDAEVPIEGLLPYAEKTVDFVFAEHVVEHVHPQRALRFFMNVLRILKPGGTFRVCVPILDRIVAKGDLEHARDLVFGHGHEMVYSFRSLHSMLLAAGFSDAVISKRKEIDGHWRVIGVEKDDLETLRMEATK